MMHRSPIWVEIICTTFMRVVQYDRMFLFHLLLVYYYNYDDDDDDDDDDFQQQKKFPSRVR